MLRVYSCIAQDHDLWLVFVAAVICLLSSYIAFAAFDQAQRRQGRVLVWAGLAAIVAGIGIWATHFVAMLAYQPGLPVGYDVLRTLLSVCAAVLITGAGWIVALKEHKAWGLCGGALVGTGVATMHYIGMSAMEVAALVVWDQTLVASSVILGVCLAAAAIGCHRSQSQRVARFAPFILTAAICSMHFTAMAAAALYPSGAMELSVGSASSGTLAILITAGTLLIFVVGFATILFERGIARAHLAEAEKRASLADEVIRGAAEREALSAKLQREVQISSAALENMAQGLSMYDEQRRLVTFNQHYANLYKLPPELLATGTPFSSMLDHFAATGLFPGTVEYYQEIVEAVGNEGGQLDVELLDGRIMSIRLNITPNGAWVFTHEDVTQARRAAAEIEYLAAHDALTGLPNRAAFMRRLATSAGSLKEGDGIAVLTVDLDRFKEVNDTLGHPFGDQILKEAARRLRGLVAKDDVVTRLGGDEFALLCHRAADAAEVARLANRVVEELVRPICFDGHTVVIGASVGVSLAPRDGIEADELLKRSDLALYRAKEECRGTSRFFEPGMDARLHERRAIEADLRIAIREGQFELYYQPLLDLSTGGIPCCEALLRWRHPIRGLIQPAHFIPIAEETDLIIPIGEWVLREACRDAAAWPGEVKVAVNLSPAQFKRGDLIPTTMSALSSAGLPAHRLELEITESILLHDEAWVRSLLDQLTSLGVRIAMDDFGTGYSSLSYLRSFPFTKIKIDRSFVADLTGTSDTRAIIEATVQLSKKLGMETTAEGVETAEQLAILTAEGCTHAQGYHVSRPMPRGDVLRYLGAHRSTPMEDPKRAAA